VPAIHGSVPQALDRYLQLSCNWPAVRQPCAKCTQPLTPKLECAACMSAARSSPDSRPAFAPAANSCRFYAMQQCSTFRRSKYSPAGAPQSRGGAGPNRSAGRSGFRPGVPQDRAIFGKKEASPPTAKERRRARAKTLETHPFLLRPKAELASVELSAEIQPAT